MNSKKIGYKMILGTSGTYTEITRSPLPQNNGSLTLPFFGGNYLIVLLDNVY